MRLFLVFIPRSLMFIHLTTDMLVCLVMRGVITEIVYFHEIQSIWDFETHLTPQILGNKPTYRISQLIGKQVIALPTHIFS